jgi:hypothetical protein
MKTQKKIQISRLFLLFFIISGIVTATTITTFLVAGNLGLIEKTISKIESLSCLKLCDADKKLMEITAISGFVQGLRQIDKYAHLKQTSPIKIDGIRFKQLKSTTLDCKEIKPKQILKNIYYFKEITYSQNSDVLLKMFFKKLKTHNLHLKVLIIDLRDNAGGKLEVAKKMLDLFLPAGKKLLFFKEEIKFNIKDQDLKTNTPAYFKKRVFILVSNKTASAAELFADIMQRYNRAIIVGTPTYGKNCMQLPIEVLPGLEIWVTAAEFEFKSGGNKIIPDVKIKKSEDALEVALKLAQK